jgi:signal transduction histidine kinase
MSTRPAAALAIAATAILAILAALAPVPVLAQAPPVKNVLVLHLGAESFPANPLIDRGIHAAFVAHPEIPISYYAEYFEDEPPITSSDPSPPFKDYLRRKFAGMPIDVVIANSDRVLRFALTHRAELFPDAPIVFWGLQVPDAATLKAGAGITGVRIGVNFVPTLKLALTLQPGLRRVFVVANNPDPTSTAATRRLLDQVPGVTLTYLEAATVRDLEKAVRAVPAGSAILYLWHSGIQPGEVIYTDEIGRRVARVSPVPVYSASELLFGHGLVGGVLRSSEETGVRVGELAVRVLGGTRPQDIPLEVARVSPVVDWRELQRWNLPASRVPADTQIRFRELTIWERYRAYIVAAVAAFAAQAVLIGALLVQRAQRKQAVEDLQRSYSRVRDLGARLLRAQEDERSRIARELHDDVSQRLAALKINLTVLGRFVDPEGQSLASEAVAKADAIGTDLRDLSHRLHPARLRVMGLAAAIDGLQTELARPDVSIVFTHDAVPPELPREVTVSLFRVVQEALHNALKYSKARTITIKLTGADGGLTLTIADDGVGFDAAGAVRTGLGLTSMQERVQALGGTLAIRSRPGAGTTLDIRVPTPPAASGEEAAM